MFCTFTEKDVMMGGSPSSLAAGWAGWAVTGVSSLTSKIYNKAKTKNTQGRAIQTSFWIKHSSNKSTSIYILCVVIHVTGSMMYFGWAGIGIIHSYRTYFEWFCILGIEKLLRNTQNHNTSNFVKRGVN